jgi:hypothetical protein
MTPLHHHFSAARSEYQAATYPGDLACELLAPEADRQPSRGWRYLLFPLVGGAIAAVLMIALWPRHKPATSRVPQVVIHADPVPLDVSHWPRNVSRLREVAYDVYVDPVKSGVNQAVRQIGREMNSAMDAPVVVQGVTTVKHVAGELQEFASVTWSQLVPRRNPGC